MVFHVKRQPRCDIARIICNDLHADHHFISGHFSAEFFLNKEVTRKVTDSGKRKRISRDVSSKLVERAWGGTRDVHQRTWEVRARANIGNSRVRDRGHLLLSSF